MVALKLPHYVLLVWSKVLCVDLVGLKLTKTHLSLLSECLYHYTRYKIGIFPTFLVVLGIEPRTLHLLVFHSATCVLL